jgi:hypothetical protein
MWPLSLSGPDSLLRVVIVLTARRNKRREKLALKTASVPVSKKGGTKARPRDSSEEECDEELDGSAQNVEQDAEKKGGRVVRKSIKDHKEPSMALLKAYEASGQVDRRRRITVSGSFHRWNLGVILNNGGMIRSYPHQNFGRACLEKE